MFSKISISKKDFWWLLVLVILTFFVRWPFREVPLERDEGAYAYFAWQMQEGQTPYVNMVEFSPPVIFFIYQFCFKIFGNTIFHIRLFTTIYVILTLIIFYYLAKKFCGRKGAIFASLFYVFLTVDPNLLGYTSNKEVFALLPLVLSFIFLEKGLENRKSYWWFLNGILQSISFLLKQVLLYNFFFILTILVWEYIRQKKQEMLLRNLLNLVAGFVAGLVSFFIYFFYKGAVKDFIYWVLIYPFHFGGQNPFGWDVVREIFYTFEDITRLSWPLWLLVILSPFIYGKTKNRRLVILWIWSIFLFLAISAGWRYREHYFQFLTPALSLLSGYVLVFLWEKYKQRFRFLKYLLILTIFLPFISLAKEYYFLTADEISRYLYGRNPFVEAKTIADYITANTSEKDKIFVFGSEPEIYFYSQRASASKFIMIYPATATYGETLLHQKYILKELSIQKPKYIILVDLQSSLYDLPFISKEYLLFRVVDILLEKYYCLDGAVYIKNKSTRFIFKKEIVKYGGLQKMDSEEKKVPDIFIFRKKEKNNRDI